MTIRIHRLKEMRTGRLVDAEVHLPITDHHLDQWERDWCPIHNRRFETWERSGTGEDGRPQSAHWDWEAKAAAFRNSIQRDSYALLCKNENGALELQAMMQVSFMRRCRDAASMGQHLLYIDYLEVAPWNVAWRSEPESIRYQGAGTIMMHTAIERSLEEGFKGRVGLHALPQANGFYSNKCEMCDYGPDEKPPLRYFEWTAEGAKAFIDDK